MVYVSSISPDPGKHIYPTIQQAVDNATERGMVAITNGIYAESVVVDKPLILVGEDRNSTIIQGDRYGVNVASDGVALVNLGIKSKEIGVYLGSSRGCNISLNLISGPSYGIVLRNCISSDIKANEVLQSSNISIYLINSSSCAIRYNAVSSSKFGIYLKGSNNNTIGGNGIQKAHDAIVLANHSSDNILTEDNLFGEIEGCQIYQVDYEGLRNRYPEGCDSTGEDEKCIRCIGS